MSGNEWSGSCDCLWAWKMRISREMGAIPPLLCRVDTPMRNMDIIKNDENEPKRTLWDIAKQEFLASLFLFLLLFPMGSALGDTNEGWMYHFLMMQVVRSNL